MKGNTWRRDGPSTCTIYDALRGDRKRLVCIPRSRYHRNAGNTSPGIGTLMPGIWKHPRFEKRSVIDLHPRTAEEEGTGSGGGEARAKRARLGSDLLRPNEPLIFDKSLITPQLRSFSFRKAGNRPTEVVTCRELSNLSRPIKHVRTGFACNFPPRGCGCV